MTTASLDLKDFIRDVPDFPKPGVLFKDITPLLGDPAAFRETIRRLAAPFRDKGIQKLVAAEARGFIFAAPMAMELNAGFVPVRKPGKLPFTTHSFSYELEYGSDTLQMHVDGVSPGEKVLVVDDLLATGGTVGACCKMLEKLEAQIEACVFLIELEFLGGIKALGNYPVYSLLKY